MADEKPTVLIVEDNKKLASLFQEALEDKFDTLIAYSLSEARKHLSKAQGLLLDLQLPDGEGISLIEPALNINPDYAIVVVTAYGTVQKAVESIRLGASDFLEKPVDLNLLLEKFEKLIVASASGEELVYCSKAMDEVVQMANRVAKTPFPVLIQGETGSGKEVLARYIHQKSGRKKMVALNCASLPSELADSLLFGHLKGSFTGAYQSRAGMIAQANEGTLFLDEIGELPQGLQPKLLRFLDSGVYTPLGSSKEERSNARIIAATNRDLESMIKEGSFRKDLYFRLATFPLRIPPLRERPEDIECLVQYHLKGLRTILGQVVEIDDNALKLLKNYHFPGNVRELFNILDRAAVLGKGQISQEEIKFLITSLDSLERDTSNSEKEEKGEDFWSKVKLEAERREKEMILDALSKSGGNKAAAARALKVSYKTLLNKMKRLGI